MGLGDEILHSMLEDINRKLSGIEEKVSQIALLEERMAGYRETMGRCFGEINKLREDHKKELEDLQEENEKLAKRIEQLEREEPVTHLVRDWVLKGVIALIAVVLSGTFIVKIGGHL